MATVIQRSAFKPGRYKGRNLSAAKLREFADATNKAIVLGIPIPGLQKHTDVFAADDEETKRFSATSGAGWLKKVLVEDDGAIGWEFDGVPPEIEKGVKDGSIKFTSPEFRFNYKSADGFYEGPIIRHVAFTPLPKVHDQGAMSLAMSEGVCIFSEDDFDGPPGDDKKPDGDKGKSDKPDDKNPDMPANTADDKQLEAVLAHLRTDGYGLPDDTDASNLVERLLTSCLTKQAAKQQAEAEKAEKEEDEDPPETKDSQNSMPFSEEEITAATPALQAKYRKANESAKAAAAQAIQFSEERAATKRKEAAAAVKAAKLPPALKKNLLGMVEDSNVVQFSEEGEQPTLTIQRAASLFAEAIPPSLQFDESEAKDVDHPDGEKFFKGDGPPSDEEAEAIARRIHSRDKSKK